MGLGARCAWTGFTIVNDESYTSTLTAPWYGDRQASGLGACVRPVTMPCARSWDGNYLHCISFDLIRFEPIIGLRHRRLSL